VSFMGGLLFFYSPILKAQNKDSVKSLSYQLAKIDTLIIKKDLKAADELISQIKKTKVYSFKKYQLEVDLRQSKILYYKNQPEKAMSLLLNQFKNTDKNSTTRALYANLLGRMFYAAKNYSKSIEYYKIALINSTKSNDTEEIMRFNLNLGNAFYKSHQF